MAPIRLAATVVAGFINSPSSRRPHCHVTKPAQHGVINLGPCPLIEKGNINNNNNGEVNISCLRGPRGQVNKRKSELQMQAPSMLLGLSPQATLYMSMLALQFACQPLLTKKFTPKSVNRSSIVMSQDIVKVIITLAALFMTGSWSTAVAGWSVKSWLTVAALPALLYSVQNVATLIAYQNLTPLTFNVLNQTKTLSAALSCYILMGKVQSKIQIVSLLLLFMSACIIEKLIPLRSSVKNSNTGEKAQGGSTKIVEKTIEEKSNHTEGVIAVLSASFISGLAGALTQRSLQSDMAGTIGRNSHFFTLEISFVSLLFMLLSTIRSADGQDIRTKGFFHNWTPKTLIPIITNASGAILVGLVTKYAGAVKKGFALIFGLVISGVLQAFLVSNNNGHGDEGEISMEQIVGGLLAAISLWMHNAFPASQNSNEF